MEVDLIKDLIKQLQNLKKSGGYIERYEVLPGINETRFIIKITGRLATKDK